MKLSYEYEKGGKVLQIITINHIKTKEDAEELNYDDFDSMLYVAGIKIGDISPVLAKSPAWMAIIDDIDWVEIWAEAKQIEIEYQTENYKYE